MPIHHFDGFAVLGLPLELTGGRATSKRRLRVETVGSEAVSGRMVKRTSSQVDSAAAVVVDADS